VPHRHYLLPSLRAGSFRHCHGGHATVITACGNSQAEAPPPPPPEVVRPGCDQIRAPVGRIHRADRSHRRSRHTSARQRYIDRIAFKEGNMVRRATFCS